MLRQRVLTGIIAVAAILLIVFALPSPVTIGVLALLILAGAWEWSAFLKSSANLARVAYVLLVAACIGVACWYSIWQHLSIVEGLFGLAMLGWLLAAIAIVRFPVRFPKPLVAIAGVFVLVPAFVALSWVYLGEDGPGRLLLLLVVVWAADIGAYFAGKRFGRIKLAPKVSPGKSWEGVIGGLILVAGISLAAAGRLQIPVTLLVPLALAVAAVSIIGDLTVSMFKRNADVKDSGTMFPGHGGVLDRIDSICAAAPLFALMLVRTGI